MTNILVPTDFSPASVGLAMQSVKALNRPVNIILFHAFKMPYYYQDLVRAAPPYTSLISDGFRQACKQLKDRYPRMIGIISFKCMRGETAAVFRHFTEANDIHFIVCPKDYQYNKVHEDSINPIPLFRKSRLPLVDILDVSIQPIQSKVTATLIMANAS